MENEHKVIPFPRRETADEWAEEPGMLRAQTDAAECREETEEDDPEEELLDIDYTPSEEARALWDALFPQGKPTPEELIQKLAELLRP